MSDSSSFPAYRFVSEADDVEVRMAALPDPQDDEATPLYRGSLRDARTSAACLFALGRIADARFHTPPGMLRSLRAAADPVVTVGDGVLRFESFSRCCSVYARVDLLPGAHDAQERRHGTTLVDFSPAMRAALGQIRLEGRLGLRIHTGGLELVREAETIFEPRIRLQDRWLRSFLHVAAFAHRLEHRATLTWTEALALLRSLPRDDRATRWLTPARTGWRASSQRSDGAVRVTSARRVDVLDPLLRGADRVDLLSDPVEDVTCWVVHHGPVRLTVMTTAEPWRGMSGEGAGLDAVRRGDDGLSATWRAKLRWQAAIPDAQAATPAMLHLASVGVVGFDAADRVWFHRELPFRPERIEALYPRLANARRLAAEGAVTLCDGGAQVRSGTQTYRVRLDPDGCDCAWAAEGQRGPCKHVLAARIVAEDAA